ncbi:MAG TPA: endonuclease [Candidatus Ozemobacteraceae bacterium]|nr:endonuclease [Candidatus Ozemobacteraceae bacterium]
MHKRSWGLSAIFATFLTASVCFAGEPNASQPIDPCERVHKETGRLLESVEAVHPDASPQIVKIRERLNYLYKRAQSESAPKDGLVPSLEAMERTASKRKRFNSRSEDPFAGLGQLSNEALVEELNKRISMNTPFEYSASRRIVFLTLDNLDGFVECVYTGRSEHVTQMPNDRDMNIEHSWPQSLGATGIAKADLHHLFPADSKANSTRGSLPYGIVSNPNWEEGGSKCDGEKFQVRPNFCGNIARAQFYFSVRYNKQIPNEVEKVLREWHKADPVDARELQRNNKVDEIQHNRNPFIDHPEFVDKIADF